MKNYLERLWKEIEKEIKLEEVILYPDLTDFKAKGKDGDVVIQGGVRHFKTDKIEKLAYGNYFMKGAEINGVSIIPNDKYDLPIFACNLSSTPKGINMDVDFYGTKDLILNPEYLERCYTPLKDTYDEFLSYEKVKKLDTDFYWTRVMRSPYWIKGLCPEEDCEPFIGFSRNYLLKWLKLCKRAEPIKDQEELALVKRRKSIIRKEVTKGDPGKSRYFAKILEDEKIIQKITDAMI